MYVGSDWLRFCFRHIFGVGVWEYSITSNLAQTSFFFFLSSICLGSLDLTSAQLSEDWSGKSPLLMREATPMHFLRLYSCYWSY